ncbi:MAG: hypothetical protein WC759_03365 [Candidatus Micrarchaeia archaeon]|jgi:hypothetical protein
MASIILTGGPIGRQFAYGAGKAPKDAFTGNKSGSERIMTSAQGRAEDRRLRNTASRLAKVLRIVTELDEGYNPKCKPSDNDAVYFSLAERLFQMPSSKDSMGWHETVTWAIRGRERRAGFGGYRKIWSRDMKRFNKLRDAAYSGELMPKYHTGVFGMFTFTEAQKAQALDAILGMGKSTPHVRESTWEMFDEAFNHEMAVTAIIGRRANERYGAHTAYKIVSALTSEPLALMIMEHEILGYKYVPLSPTQA